MRNVPVSRNISEWITSQLLSDPIDGLAPERLHPQLIELLIADAVQVVREEGVYPWIASIVIHRLRGQNDPSALHREVLSYAHRVLELTGRTQLVSGAAAAV